MTSDDVSGISRAQQLFDEAYDRRRLYVRANDGAAWWIWNFDTNSDNFSGSISGMNIGRWLLHEMGDICCFYTSSPVQQTSKRVSANLPFSLSLFQNTSIGWPLNVLYANTCPLPVEPLDDESKAITIKFDILFCDKIEWDSWAIHLPTSSTRHTHTCRATEMIIKSHMWDAACDARWQRYRLRSIQYRHE